LVVATAVVGFKIYCQDEGVAYDGFEIYAYPTLLALFAVEILLIFLTRRRFAETVAATSTQGSADAIAGYYTGVALTSMVEREVARAGRAGRALAILMIDVALDDPNGGGANGSPAPDVGKMTRLIRESTRNSDVLGQFEPGELALVLSDTPTDHAGIVAAKLRRRLDTLAPNADPGRLNVKLVTARQAEDGTGIVWRFDEAFEEPVIGG
jgi:GGDEF domain-containing protein